MEILVFKTNVDSKRQVRRLFPILRTLQGIARWNVDLHDADNILRVEAISISPRSIETVVQQAGYFCKELL